MSLRIFWMLLAGGVIFGAPPGIFAQSVPEPQGFTAQEYMDRAASLYAGGKYEEAAATYEKLSADFGEAKEAAELIRSTLSRHAMCLIHLRKFSRALDAIEAALKAQPPFPQGEIQELQFWLGVARLEEKNYPEARAALEKFISLFPADADRVPTYINQYPAAMRIPEARLLIGSAWLLEEKFREAAGHFASLKPGLARENRGRSVVLQLFALLQANDNEAAMKVIGEESPGMGELAQIVTFQTLTLELGNRWLEQGELRKAIICLQRVWTSERLLKHQQQLLADLESRLQAAESRQRSDPYNKFLLGQLIQNVRREIENFKKITSFDAALRLRLASAYQAMKRHREAALIMEDMLDRMPPDKIVEQASVNLVQSWFEIERWPKVSQTARAFVEKFPGSPDIPLVLYLDGLAAQKDNRMDDALATLNRLLKDYPDSEFAPRAHFMKGFTQLLAEKNPEAVGVFEDFLKKYPKHELAESASYWRAMGYSLDKQFEKARAAMDDCLDRYKDGQHTGSATFRKAYCAQQLEDYTTSIGELGAYLRNFPGHEEASEARILLGDALMNEGRMEEGIAVFQSIPREDTRFYEEGVFKVGKAFKLMEEYDRLLEHMTAFQNKNPRSPRVAEAVFHIGWVHRQQENPEKARDVYWKAIAELGDDPGIRSVEDLFPALSKLYKGDEAPAQYLARLRDMREEAARSGKKTLAMRCLWAQASALRRSDPDKSRSLLLEAAALADVQTANPLLLGDFAEALAASGRTKEATGIYRDLLKWNPRAPQKDRALAALGFVELGQGNEKAALEWFNRFEQETPSSREAGRVSLARSALLAQRGQSTDALKVLDALLANEQATGNQKAEALYRIGEIHMKTGKPALAVPYFQRIYVMHGRWRDWVAKAYLGSGEAFEKLNDPFSARKTYQEFGEKEDLTEFPESASAKKRLEALGGPVAQPTPAQS